MTDINSKEPDKYTGMVGFDMDLTPSVYICGAAGAVLGAILAYWGTSDMAIVVATSVTFAAFTMASAASIMATRPLVSTIPSASPIDLSINPSDS